LRVVFSLLTASALLAGCADPALFSPAQDFSAPGPCGALARQRLEDARMSGYAQGYEKAIFDHAHRECLAREAASPPR
jgi:hypothetical protein